MTSCYWKFVLFQTSVHEINKLISRGHQATYVTSSTALPPDEKLESLAKRSEAKLLQSPDPDGGALTTHTQPHSGGLTITVEEPVSWTVVFYIDANYIWQLMWLTLECLFSVGNHYSNEYITSVGIKSVSYTHLTLPTNREV